MESVFQGYFTAGNAASPALPMARIAVTGGETGDLPVCAHTPAESDSPWAVERVVLCPIAKFPPVLTPFIFWEFEYDGRVAHVTDAVSAVPLPQSAKIFFDLFKILWTYAKLEADTKLKPKRMKLVTPGMLVGNVESLRSVIKPDPGAAYRTMAEQFIARLTSLCPALPRRADAFIRTPREYWEDLYRFLHSPHLQGAIRNDPAHLVETHANIPTPVFQATFHPEFMEWGINPDDVARMHTLVHKYTQPAIREPTDTVDALIHKGHLVPVGSRFVFKAVTEPQNVLIDAFEPPMQRAGTVRTRDEIAGPADYIASMPRLLNATPTETALIIEHVRLSPERYTIVTPTGDFGVGSVRVVLCAHGLSEEDFDPTAHYIGMATVKSVFADLHKLAPGPAVNLAVRDFYEARKWLDGEPFNLVKMDLSSKNVNEIQVACGTSLEDVITTVRSEARFRHKIKMTDPIFAAAAGDYDEIYRTVARKCKKGPNYMTNSAAPGQIVTYRGAPRVVADGSVGAIATYPGTLPRRGILDDHSGKHIKFKPGTHQITLEPDERVADTDLSTGSCVPSFVEMSTRVTAPFTRTPLVLFCDESTDIGLEIHAAFGMCTGEVSSNVICVPLVDGMPIPTTQGAIAQLASWMDASDTQVITYQRRDPGPHMAVLTTE